MKSISIQVIFILFITGTMFGQIETFEDETREATSFTLNGINFTTTGDLFIEEIIQFGCDQSDRFLGTGTQNGGSSASFGSIKVTNPGDKFTISTSTLWCMWSSPTDGFSGASGDIKFKRDPIHWRFYF